MVVELIDRLETAGLVRRERAADDRRRARVAITPRGEQLLRELSAAPSRSSAHKHRRSSGRSTARISASALTFAESASHAWPACGLLPVVVMETMNEQTATEPEIARNEQVPAYITTRPSSNKLARSIALGIGAVVGPAALGAGIAALTGSRRAGWIAGGVSLATLAAARWQLQRWFTDEPEYTLEQRIGELEIRRYAPRVEASIRVDDSDFERALEDGFLHLAKYIFGGNDAEQKLAMTTPVMATPVTGNHLVTFVMPVGRTLESLPRPTDTRIELVERPAQRVAVLEFRGRYSDDVVGEQMARLRELVAAQNLSVRGEPVFAGFDPPSTLPAWRRTEVWIELDPE